MNLDLAKIDAIIFDLGGVILDINIEGVFKKFKDAGIGNGKPGLEVIKTNKAFTQFETGKITPAEFRDEIRKDSKNDFTDEVFDSIWNSMLLPYSKERIVFLEKIRLKYRTFLMSNTNIIHFETYSKTLNDNFGYRHLDDLFEKAYYSHTSGMRKPDTAFYELILKENRLIAENTLFVDDFIENIKAAESLNIKTYHIANGNTILDLY